MVIIIMVIIIITCDGGSEENPDDDEYPSVGAKAVLAVCFDPRRTEKLTCIEDDHDDDGDLCSRVINDHGCFKAL